MDQKKINIITICISFVSLIVAVSSMSISLFDFLGKTWENINVDVYKKKTETYESWFEKSSMENCPCLIYTKWDCIVYNNSNKKVNLKKFKVERVKNSSRFKNCSEKINEKSAISPKLPSAIEEQGHKNFVITIAMPLHHGAYDMLVKEGLKEKEKYQFGDLKKTLLKYHMDFLGNEINDSYIKPTNRINIFEQNETFRVEFETAHTNRFLKEISWYNIE